MSILDCNVDNSDILAITLQPANLIMDCCAHSGDVCTCVPSCAAQWTFMYGYVLDSNVSVCSAE